MRKTERQTELCRQTKRCEWREGQGERSRGTDLRAEGLGGGAPTCRMATEMMETEVWVTRALSSQSLAKSCLYLGGHGSLGGAMTEVPREPSRSG